MVTEVMQPKDLLTVTRVPPVPVHRRPNIVGNGDLTNLTVNRKGSSVVHRKATPKSVQKKFNKGSKAKKPTPTERGRKHGVSDSGLVMGQVTLLRRGESFGLLASKIKGGESEPTSPNKKPVVDLAVRESDLIEPLSPLMVVTKQINVQALADEYSGSAFYSSPSPRSVPVPSFFMKQLVHGEIKSFDDSATKDLRRLLRLD